MCLPWIGPGNARQFHVFTSSPLLTGSVGRVEIPVIRSVSRIKVKELVMATNPNVEGRTTAAITTTYANHKGRRPALLDPRRWAGSGEYR